MITIATVLLGIAFLAIAEYFISKKQNTFLDSISTPPPMVPAPTPPVIVESIILGEAMYYDMEQPEYFVTPVSVKNGMVEFIHNDAIIDTLPVAEFMVRYVPREQTKIS